jgi:hypothetical protein
MKYQVGDEFQGNKDAAFPRLVVVHLSPPTNTYGCRSDLGQPLAYNDNLLDAYYTLVGGPTYEAQDTKFVEASSQVPTQVSLPALSGEVTITDPVTGGKKGQKPARFDLLPWNALREIAEHYGKGAEKYDDRNWEKGYDWSLSYAALQRHLTAWWQGEDIDAETGSSHLAAVAFHVLALLTFKETHPEKDNRPK